MGCNKLLRFAFQNLSRRKIHVTAERTSNWRGLVRKELLESGSPVESESVCIYRIPPNILQAEPKAFIPNNISIGPYHYGAPHLQNMEMLKKKFFRRLFHPNGINRDKLEDAFKTLEGLEDKAHACYQDKVKLSSDEFLHMMLVDGSFIIQFLRDLSMNKSKQGPHLTRWMLPIIRRELMMLENQIPLFVLSKLFDLTDNSPAPGQPAISLNALAVPFFVGLRNNLACEKADEVGGEHLLDLHRSSIWPKLVGEEPRGTQKHMVRSVTELKEAGVKIKAADNRQLLDISFGRKWGIFMRELSIPTLRINDHRGTMLRNMLAFEKCHKRCNPDVTTYVFFFNRLINTADDVAHLHHKGVLHHSLGSDEKMAELINNITREIVPDMNESYLHKVVNQANEYCRSKYARARASIVHYYLSSWTVGISTMGALLALYFTSIQTVSGFVGAFKEPDSKSFSSIFKHALTWPFHDTGLASFANIDRKK